MSKLKIAVGLTSGLAAGGVALTYWQRWRLVSRFFNLPSNHQRVRVERNLHVPMPDGVTLATDHYYPAKAGDYPTLLRRTPYGRNTSSGTLGLYSTVAARFLAQHGYHVLVQDVRGRFGSEGVFAPFENDADDGLATLEWIAAQPWFNGAVGTWGESYSGWTQWTLTPNPPPYLKAMLPAISGSYAYSYAYPTERVFSLAGILAWVYGLERSHPKGGWSPASVRRQLRPTVIEAALAAPLMHLPMGEVDEQALGQAVPYLRNIMLREQSDHPGWQSLNYRTKLPQMSVPVHMVSGWYDIFLHDVLDDYAALRSGDQQPYLSLGPFTHSLDATLHSLYEGLKWYATHLKGERGLLREQPVCVYVMGADQWRELEDWPPPANLLRYYLWGQGELANEPAASSPPDHYRYDPTDPTPSLGGPLIDYTAGPVDNRSLESRSDVLTYTTAPLIGPLEVIGSVRAELYVSSSLEYADFFARLCDVHPDGRSINICDGLLRLRPGSGEPQPDGSLRIEVDMSATAHQFKAGHRLRMQVSSGAHPRFNRNSGTVEVALTATHLLPADQTIYHDAAHPSAIVLPVVSAQD